MKITAIKQQVKQAGRYSIFVEGKYAFSLSESGLLEHGLASGQELDRKELAKFKQASADDKLYNAALRFATMRPRSTWEMEEYLRRKKASPELVKGTLEKLGAVGIVDDESFARSWIDNRTLLKPTSLRRLRQELKVKRVPDDIVEKVLSENQPDELQTLRQVIDKKIGRYPDKQKLMRYLASQGFHYDTIKTVLAERD